VHVCVKATYPARDTLPRVLSETVCMCVCVCRKGGGGGVCMCGCVCGCVLCAGTVRLLSLPCPLGVRGETNREKDEE